MARGRTRWVILIFLAVLPAQYAGYEVFRYAEPLAVPRPFAEAFVLMALALYAAGRKVAGVVALLIAALFHPIMALPGVVVYAWLIFFDPRERVAKPIVGIACVVLAAACLAMAAALGLPVADRLVTVVDPAWREILDARSAYLFVSAWPIADWSRLIVQAVTVLIAASLATGRVRSLFSAVLCVAVGGVLASLLLGDAFQSLLIVQVQPWRATWLLAVFAAAGLALCAVGLWKRGSVSRLTLALLVLAWIESHVPAAAIVASVLALGLTFLPLRPEIGLRGVSLVMWGVVAFCAALVLGTRLYAFVLLATSAPDGAWVGLEGVRDFYLLSIPLCLLAALWAIAKPDICVTAATCAAAIVLVVFAALMWDDRNPRQIAIDSFGPDPALRDLVSCARGRGPVDRQCLRHVEPSGETELGEPASGREQRLLALSG
jgi:hypothetical protein